MGRVYRPEREQHGSPPRPVVSRRPNDDELRAIADLLPRQPRRVAVLLSGDRERSGWWGPGRPASWADAVDAARLVAESCGVTLAVAADQHAPWHPGRCAALTVEGELVGHAGELHPQTIAAMGLPERTCAMEIELDALTPHDDVPARAPHFSTYPVAKEDLALIVDDDVPSVVVADALRRGGGDIVESVRLFDIYAGEQLEAGKRSLAFAVRLRAPDHTLTSAEVAQVREAAITEAERVTGAVLRT
jgi:phenylalanyl-tRNA synthetase beta chain